MASTGTRLVAALVVSRAQNSLGDDSSILTALLRAGATVGALKPVRLAAPACHACASVVIVGQTCSGAGARSEHGLLRVELHSHHRRSRVGFLLCLLNLLHMSTPLHFGR